MVLDRQHLEAILTETVGLDASESFCVHLFDTLPSTNQTLWNLIAQGSGSGTVVIATQQTAGRGQWGRQWYSPTGGLYLSVAIAPNLPAPQSYQLTLSSAWGIATALRDRGILVNLKWPNDLILCERKLGGILTETKVHAGRITYAVVGVGINWANPVPETGISLRSFLANQPETSITSLEMLAAVTLLGITSGSQCFLREGIDNLLPSYHNLLTSMGRVVSVNGQFGTIVGITSTGELRVRIDTGKSDDYLEKAANSLDAPEICFKPGTISLGYI